MSFMTKIFGGKTTTVTSAMIRAEIARAEGESNTLRAKLGDQTASVALLTDDEHIKVEADIAATRRAIARLEARLAHLNDELPRVIEAEAATATDAANAALVARANAARKANAKIAAKLLADYDSHAAQIGDTIARLKEISEETSAVNAKLRVNPVAATVESYHNVFRKSPDQPASETREMRPHWIYRDIPIHATEVGAIIQEDTILATIDANGEPLKPAGTRFSRDGRVIQPQLQMLEVVSRTRYRPGGSEESLDAVRLPPGFSGGSGWHWPRG